MLLLGRELAECTAARRLHRGLEDRVVAEAAGTLRDDRDPTAARPAPHDDLEGTAIADRGGARQGEDADVPGEAALRRQPGELLQQLRVVLLVRGARTRVAAGPNARSPIERLDLQARIVGERRQARRPSTESGLDPGVRLERQAILDWIAADPEVIE
jgi:hypothetical protein